MGKLKARFTGRKFFNEKEEDFYEYELEIPKPLYDGLIIIAEDQGITVDELIAKIMNKWTKGEL